MRRAEDAGEEQDGDDGEVLEEQHGETGAARLCGHPPLVADPVAMLGVLRQRSLLDGAHCRRVAAAVRGDPLDHQRAAGALVAWFGDEYTVLMDAPLDAMVKIVEPRIAEAIIKVREEKVKVIPGYDGVYGQLVIFENSEETKPKKEAKSKAELKPSAPKKPKSTKAAADKKDKK